MNADSVCLGGQTNSCGSGSAEPIALFAIVGVFLLIFLAICAQFYGWRYVWLYLLPARTRRRLVGRFHLEDDDRDEFQHRDDQGE